MKNRLLVCLPGLLVLPLALFLLLAQWRLPLALPESPALYLDPLNQPGQSRRALVALQTSLTERHYQSSKTYFGQLDQWLSGLRQQLPDAELLVLLPEHTGSWLVAADESWLTYLMPDTASALIWPALRQPLAFWRQLQLATEPDALAAALFRLKAQQMAQSYQSGMARLARKHKLTLAAGSLVLPAPRLAHGQLEIGAGPLTNVAALFGPDGAILGLSHKRFPVASELSFITPADTPAATINTDFGPVTLLVCADSWYPESWQQLPEQNLVLVSSWLEGEQSWRAPWRGYNGAPMPADVNPEHLQQLQESEAWLRYALPGRGGLRTGINTFGRDRLWNLRASGQAIAITGGEHWLGVEREGPVASIFWIEADE